jgi:hypothetical protein
MGVHVSFALLFLLAAGLMVFVAFIGLVLFLVLRKRQLPRGFDVLPPNEQQPR